MRARPGPLDELVDGGRRLDDLRLRRPAAAHRDDDHVVLRGREPGELPGHRRLADPLARSRDRDRRHPDRRGDRRIEPEIGPDVGQAEREHPAREAEPFDRAEHGLVGEVDDEVGNVLGDRLLEAGRERDAVALASTQLLLAADEHGRDELVRQLGERLPYDVRVVLPVDDRDCPHVCGVISDSMLATCFS